MTKIFSFAIVLYWVASLGLGSPVLQRLDQAGTILNTELRLSGEQLIREERSDSFDASACLESCCGCLQGMCPDINVEAAIKKAVSMVTKFGTKMLERVMAGQKACSKSCILGSCVNGATGAEESKSSSDEAENEEEGEEAGEEGEEGEREGRRKKNGVGKKILKAGAKTGGKIMKERLEERKNRKNQNGQPLPSTNLDPPNYSYAMDSTYKPQAVHNGGYYGLMNNYPETRGSKVADRVEEDWRKKGMMKNRNQKEK